MKDEIAELKDIYEDKINNISASIAISGGINVETNVKFNFLTNSYTFVEQKGNFYNEARGIVAFGQFVKGKAEVKSIFYKEFFSFSPFKTEMKLETKLEIDCSFGIVQQFGKDKDGLFIETKIKSSGINGEYKYNASIKKDGLFSLDSDKIKKPKKFTILEGNELTLYKVYLIKI
jgi:hypothetical protein